MLAPKALGHPHRMLYAVPVAAGFVPGMPNMGVAPGQTPPACRHTRNPDCTQLPLVYCTVAEQRNNRRHTGMLATGAVLLESTVGHSFVGLGTRNLQAQSRWGRSATILDTTISLRSTGALAEHASKHLLLPRSEIGQAGPGECSGNVVLLQELFNFHCADHANIEPEGRHIHGILSNNCMAKRPFNLPPAERAAAHFAVSNSGMNSRAALATQCIEAALGPAERMALSRCFSHPA